MGTHLPAKFIRLGGLRFATSTLALTLTALLFTLSANAFAAIMETTPQGVAQTLTALDTWVLAQPKAVTARPDASFDLSACKGIVTTDVPRKLAQKLSDRLAAATGMQLSLPDTVPAEPVISLVLASEPGEFPPALNVDAALFEQLGDQGYALAIDKAGITLAARTATGLGYAITTLTQIAAGRKVLPGLLIYDWPSMKYRGVQQDISRGQVPKPETLQRLADVLAEGKMNQMELYIEHVYKYKAFPDISPPEGLAAGESRELTLYAAQRGVEVHPFLQVLGHSYFILKMPQYQHLRIGPCEKAPWIMTFDIRKPEAVQMVTTMIDELCETVPGELFNVDITEVDIDGLQATGMTLDQITDLVFNYVLQLNDAVKKHGRRLMIAQGPLDSQGHLSGMGPKLDQLPKDIIIGSYYCAGGPYQPAYEKDFPRLQEKGFDFFAQAWINSHVWLSPWINNAAKFSDLEVSRGLKYGAIGSITCDWGDAGHFHFIGEEWLPYLYHGACAWTGAQVDRDYFRQAYARCMYGLTSDAVTRAIEASSDVNAKTIRVRDKDGKETDITTSFIWEFVHDPFTHPDITRIVDPAAVGQTLVDAALPALLTVASESPKAKRNRDNLEQYTFGIRCYLALGHKLLALGHYKDESVPRARAAEELEAVAKEFETLQTDFQRLWLAEDRDNSGYQDLVKRFLYTIIPCREKAKALLEGKEQLGTNSDLGKGTSPVKEFAEKNIHWLGHDSFKLVGQKTVIIDPFKLDKAEKADIICITHAHFDHLSPEDIAKVQGPDTVIVAPEDCAKKLTGNVQVIKPGKKLIIDGVEIEAVPAYNTNKDFHPKANGWVGYIITLDKIRIYHAGDTDRIPEMKDIRADMALLPVSGTYVMTADEAAQAALDIKPEVAIPMHYGSIVGEPKDALRFQELLKDKMEVIVKNKE
jgi:L-ascorbate metabolism protein UlaG (beta-lactamase superfamily)